MGRHREGKVHKKSQEKGVPNFPSGCKLKESQQKSKEEKKEDLGGMGGAHKRLGVYA